MQLTDWPFFAYKQTCNFNITLRVSEILPCENEIFNKGVGHSVFCDLFLLLILVAQMLLDPGNCLAKLNYTAVMKSQSFNVGDFVPACEGIP